MLFLLMAVFGGLRAERLWAQSSYDPVVMHTGSGNVLLTQSLSYTDADSGSGTLTVDFGFATAEQPQPGVFQDSFTVSVSGPDGIAYLVTVDANGPVWAPVTPGAILVDGTMLQHTPTAFLVSSEGLPLTAAFEVTYALPATWLKVPLQVTFDLLDNQDLQPSLAYYRLRAVPEPGSAVLLLLGMLLWGCSRAKR